MTYAPGWYDDGSGTNTRRWWDGNGWTQHVEQPTAFGAGAAAVASAAPAPEPGTTTQAYPATEALAPANVYAPAEAFAPVGAPRKRMPIWPFVAGGAAFLLLVGGVISAAGAARNVAAHTAASPAAVSDTSDRTDSSDDDATDDAEPSTAPVQVTVPDLTGKTAAEAAAALTALGLAPQVTTGADATVTGTTPAAGTSVAEGTSIAIAAQEKPKLTLGQSNAISKAQSYLEFTSFSRLGLIAQLEFEDFPTADATFAVDSLGVDWNAQAGAKAKEYLSFTSFSRQGLIDQLVFEKFTPEQAAAGAAAVGY